MYDAHVNIWEWTCYKYTKKYRGLEQECTQKIDSVPRVARGGAWNTWDLRDLRFAVRKPEKPYIRKNILGFRLALDF